MSASPLTDRQLRCLVAFVACWKVCGRAPKLAELARHSGIPIGDSGPVETELVYRGLLIRSLGTPRNQRLRPTPAAYDLLRHLGVTGLDEEARRVG